ncbi:hypothetical protein [uncultured Methanomethylovorans sp.]|uniref:hypothetical protein n=1 Tax=uncultured Methanomethylovorans sp. TaxID=183759 RepID=UPI002AA94E2A|nr:hypothetical protein [uncultured Methanomethylovorans sp.]
MKSKYQHVWEAAQAYESTDICQHWIDHQLKIADLASLKEHDILRQLWEIYHLKLH